MNQTTHSCRRVGIVLKTIMLLAVFALVQPANLLAAPPPKPPPQLELTVLGSYSSGIFGQGGAEIVAHDPLKQRLYVVNAQAASVDVLDISKPARIRKIGEINLLLYGGVANSVAVHEGLVAVALEAIPKTDPGTVVFFDARLKPISAVMVGSQPDMLTFTHNGRYVLVANEGEPNTYNNFGSETNGPSVDPEGSVSIIDLGGGVENLTQADVRTAGFTHLIGRENELRAAGIRIFGPNANAAQDIEPEYIAVSPDDTIAWATLQENNALAIIDIASAAVLEVVPLGLKDHSLPGNALDGSDQDGPTGGRAIKIVNQPVFGMYLPDAIATFEAGGQLYLVMANEGDARDWPGFREDVRLSTRTLDPAIFPDAATLQANTNLGRLNVSSVDGNLDGDAELERIHCYGGRSFSIRNPLGGLVYDSGDFFERKLADLHAAGQVIFNTSHDNNTLDSRSPSKGPEPEGVAVGRAFQRTWAFIGLERVGGLMVYDVTDPVAARFVTYKNNRNFTVAPSLANLATVGDLGPEGVIFINEDDSPTGEPLVVVGNEISGTTTIYQVNKVN